MKTKRQLGLRLFVLLAVCLLAAVSFSGSIQAAPRGWYLLWHDEFEGDSLDETKWVAEDAALVKNKELQYYTPDDVYVHDGVLTLRSQKRPMGGREYTSGLVETKGKFAQKYGRFEIRAKLPATRGMWPAHWLLPADGRWPPEIDIMEMVGHKPTMVLGTIHWGKWPNNRYYSQCYKGPDFSKDFHTFAIEWEPGSIKWFVDGKQYSQVKAHVPEEPFYIILNTAVGGMWPGNPDETTVFPQYHDIDYVRVYVKEVPGYYYLTTYADKGDIKVSPNKDIYKKNSRVALKAEPRLGYRFTKWLGSVKGSDNPTSVIMNNHKKVKAVFELDPQAPKSIAVASIKASSAEVKEGSDLTAANLIDSNLKTRWSSDFTDEQWILIDLGQVYNISDIRLNWENAHAKSYDIAFSLDKKSWQKVYSQDNSQGGIEEIRDINKTARYIKLDLNKRATQWGYSLWEIEIFSRDDSSQGEGN
jgi:beta-glucanase (GH16 family)